MRRLRDRDFLRTREGFLFCVVGYAHPRNRVISYLKYIPSSDGLWTGGGKRYARTMPNYTIPSLLSNIEMLKKNYPQYVFHSRVFNVEMSAVPHNCIAEYFLPEVKLQTLLASNKLDLLQKETVELVSIISSESGVSKYDFGITGSILTDIHNPLFSDIDLTICGGTNAWKVREALKQTSDISFLHKSCEKRTLDHWLKNYSLTVSEAETIYKLKWNYGYFKDRPFSIHAVRKHLDNVEQYGEKHFFPQGIVEGMAEVTAADESLFLPCTYKVSGLEVKFGGRLVEVNEVVSYDGFYIGLFEAGNHISIKGKLEKLISKDGRNSLRILIGSPEAKGGDYLKPR
jgi:predicted nucleotidyltransferase